jgi:aminoethylphosphonate catabolism LysR family transcriptional regulator
MNISELRAFHAVASAGGFTRAAERLRLTQPTLSSQVAALEARYGVVLLHRRGRRVEPTTLGLTLLSVTRRLFDVEQEAGELLAAAQSLKAGFLRLGADSPHHIIEKLAAYNRRYPGIKVSLAIGNSAGVLQDLLDYRIDVAVLADVPADPRLVTRALRRDPLVVFVPRRHPWAKRANVALADLAGQRMVMREPGSITRALITRALEKRGVTVDAVMEIDSREAVREAVAAGLGLGVVSKAEFGADARLAAIPIRDPDVTMTEYLVRLAERRPSRVVQAFLELFAAILASPFDGGGKN